jgi:phosphatidylserine/phosphatidylglycerophosphate/cardiolipin synthase-like enzyme
MYGTTSEGGAKNAGVLYRLDIPRYVYLLGWWLTDDFPILVGDGNSTMQQLLSHESTSGVQVRAVLWDSNQKSPDQPRYWPFTGLQNRQAVADINAMDNGAAIHDNNTPDFGAHYHKVLCVAGSQGLIAFCGGLDINPDRIYDTGQGPNSAGITKGAPLHDVHCRVQGPAAGDLVDTFMERWNDHSDHVDLDQQKGELRAKYAMKPTSMPTGTCTVQVGRTFPNGARYTGIHGTYPLNSGYAFAPRGETSAARIILHGIAQARKFIYLEDQYFVDTAPNKVGLDVRAALISALPHIQALIVVIPHGSITDMGSPTLDNQVNYRRKKLIDALKQAPGGDKVHIFFRKDPGRPHTYVHAKTWVFDDEYCIIGSANLNRRSWTHDSETVLGICDQGDGSSCHMPHRLRIRLWLEQLGLPKIPENVALLSDATAALPLWINLPPTAQVMHYDKITPEENPSDESWDRMIDPDGS